MESKSFRSPELLPTEYRFEASEHSVLLGSNLVFATFSGPWSRMIFLALISATTVILAVLCILIVCLFGLGAYKLLHRHRRHSLAFNTGKINIDNEGEKGKCKEGRNRKNNKNIIDLRTIDKSVEEGKEMSRRAGKKLPPDIQKTPLPSLPTTIRLPVSSSLSSLPAYSTPSHSSSSSSSSSSTSPPRTVSTLPHRPQLIARLLPEVVLSQSSTTTEPTSEMGYAMHSYVTSIEDDEPQVFTFHEPEDLNPYSVPGTARNHHSSYHSQFHHQPQNDHQNHNNQHHSFHNLNHYLNNHPAPSSRNNHNKQSAFLSSLPPWTVSGTNSSSSESRHNHNFNIPLEGRIRIPKPSLQNIPVLGWTDYHVRGGGSGRGEPDGGSKSLIEVDRFSSYSEVILELKNRFSKV